MTCQSAYLHSNHSPLLTASGVLRLLELGRSGLDSCAEDAHCRWFCCQEEEAVSFQMLPELYRSAHSPRRPVYL